jgi:hypothetical protein
MTFQIVKSSMKYSRMMISKPIIRAQGISWINQKLFSDNLLLAPR